MAILYKIKGTIIVMFNVKAFLYEHTIIKIDVPQPITRQNLSLILSPVKVFTTNRYKYNPVNNET